MVIIKDILTNIDGSSYVAVKVVSVLIVLFFLGLTTASFITGKPFDMTAYGIAAATVVGAMTAGIKFSPENPEPK